MRFAPISSDTLPLYVINKDDPTGMDALPDIARNWAKSNDFTASLGAVLCVPDADGTLAMALVGNGNARDRARKRFGLAAARSKLPEGTYNLHSNLDGDALDEAALGWLLAGYRFTRYAPQTPLQQNWLPPRVLTRRGLKRLLQARCSPAI